MNTLHKISASLAVIAGFAVFAIQHGASASAAVAHDVPAMSASTALREPAANSIVTVAQPVSSPASAPAQMPATPSATADVPASTVTRKGKYADGTFTGVAADAIYGQVQVQVTISGGRIASISFLQYPQDRSTSRGINRSAMSGLVSQAITLQSPDVSGVSGATDTTLAFRQSLSSALSQAA